MAARLPSGSWLPAGAGEMAPAAESGRSPWLRADGVFSMICDSLGGTTVCDCGETDWPRAKEQWAKSQIVLASAGITTVCTTARTERAHHTTGLGCSSVRSRPRRCLSLVDGIVRAATLPGEVTEFDIGLWSTSIVVAAGERLCSGHLEQLPAVGSQPQYRRTQCQGDSAPCRAANRPA